jgi:hypothetical protein
VVEVGAGWGVAAVVRDVREPPGDADPGEPPDVVVADVGAIVVAVGVMVIAVVGGTEDGPAPFAMLPVALVISIAYASRPE